MAIYQLAEYQVNPKAADKVRRAIKEFVAYVKANEPGTRLYMAWEKKDDPGHFVHLFIFADEAAHKIHGKSEAVKKFESVYAPELAKGKVIFTDYNMIASNS